MNDSLKWACTSVGTCAASFLAYAIPTLQAIALALSIWAAVRSLRKDRK
jgi:hypothetical protein